MRCWKHECEAGRYEHQTLSGLLWAIIAHRWWHWRRGDGWID
jgi:hypothetical protein